MIRTDLIQREFELRDLKNMRPHSLHKSTIKFIMKNYTPLEIVEVWFDSEPADYPAELIDLFGTDDYSELYENIKFIEWNNKRIQEYEPHRLEFNNWQEPYFVGNWGMTQEALNRHAQFELMNCRDFPINKINRFWTGSDGEDNLICYWYGRDTEWKYDLFWVFKRKENA